MARRPPEIERMAAKLAGCEGKAQYMSKGAALVVIKRMTGRHSKHKASDLSAYRCRFCKAFHIGNH